MSDKYLNLKAHFKKNSVLVGKGESYSIKVSVGVVSPYTVASSNTGPTLLHPQSETVCPDRDFRDFLYPREPSAVLLHGIASLSVNGLF